MSDTITRGQDHFYHKVDPNFMAKGDPFRAHRFSRDEMIVVYGEAAMNGHAVDPKRGWLSPELSERARELKRDSYDGTTASYINVRLDHKSYTAYRNESETLYPVRDGWEFYSTRAVADRKQAALDEYESRAAEAAQAERARHRDDALAEVERAQAALDAAFEKLRELGYELGYGSHF